jgi:hypothetical protein
MDYPFQVPVCTGNVVQWHGGLNTVVTDGTTPSSLVYVPGPSAKVLFVLTDIQSSNGVNTSFINVGAAPGAVAVLEWANGAHQNIIGGADRDIGLAMRDATEVWYPNDNNTVMSSLLRYYRYYNSSDCYKSAFVVASDYFNLYQASSRTDGVNDSLNLMAAFPLGGIPYNTGGYTQFTGTADLRRVTQTWNTALTVQPTVGGLNRNWGISMSNPDIYVSLAAGYCRYSNQLVREEQIDNIGKFWSMMNQMSLGMATMMDELSRTQGWPEAFIYGYEQTVSGRSDEVVRRRLLPAVNGRLSQVISRPQVRLDKGERFALGNPFATNWPNAGDQLMTLSRMHPFWTQWFFGYDYMNKDNSIDLSREKRKAVRIDVNTVLFRLEELFNGRWAGEEKARRVISQLMNMGTLYPNNIGTPIRMLTESGDVDVSTLFTYTAPAMYALFRQVQSIFIAIPVLGATYVSLPIMAPPICYDTTDFRSLRPAISSNIRYLLEGKQMVSEMIAYPSSLNRLYSDLFIPEGEELPFLGEFSISWDGRTPSRVDAISVDEGGDDYIE